jgi:hypothetical protein
MTPVSQIGAERRGSDLPRATKTLFFPLFNSRSQIGHPRVSPLQQKITRAVHALTRCRNASNELELHCLSAANPFLFRLIGLASRPGSAEKFFSEFLLRGP